MEIFIVIVLWFGIGYIARITHDYHYTGEETNETMLTRFVVIVIWPIAMLGYILLGKTKY